MSKHLCNSFLKKLCILIVLLVISSVTIPPTFAQSPSTNLTYQLVYVTHNKACGNYDYQMANEYDWITTNYLKAYGINHYANKPQCISEYKLESYYPPQYVDLFIIIYSKNLGRDILHENNAGGFFNWITSGNPGYVTIEACDCPSHVYGDPDWILSHELAHFILYYLGYSEDVFVGWVHQIQNIKFTYCPEGEFYVYECKNIYTTLESPSNHFNLMVPYSGAYGMTPPREKYNLGNVDSVDVLENLEEIHEQNFPELSEEFQESGISSTFDSAEPASSLLVAQIKMHVENPNPDSTLNFILREQGPRTIELPDPVNSIIGIWVTATTYVEGVTLYFDDGVSTFYQNIEPNSNTIIEFEYPFEISNIRLSFDKRGYSDDAIHVVYVYAEETEDTKEIQASGTEQQNTKAGGCLIATATYGSELAPQVQLLREIRDNIVFSTASGASFMTAFNSFYYSFSPTVADWERQNPAFKEAVKLTITPLITTLSTLQYVDIDSEAEMLGYGISIILLNIGMYFVTPMFVILILHSKLRNLN